MPRYGDAIHQRPAAFKASYRMTTDSYINLGGDPRHRSRDDVKILAYLNNPVHGRTREIANIILH